MLILQEHAKAMCEKLTQIYSSRYKVFALCGSPMSGKTTLAKEVCINLKGRYIDIMTELLPYIEKPVLGAYSPAHLVRWMESQLKEPEQVVCFDEIEALIATFGEQGAVNLFEILKTLEPRNVIIVATQLENVIAKVAFPKNRIYFLSS